MNIIEKIKGFFMRLFNSQITEQITGLRTNITAEMMTAIELWNDIVEGVAPWNKESPSCGLMRVIAGSLSDAINEEINVTSENETVKQLLDKLNEDNYKTVQFMLGVGGCALRPVFSNGRVQYELLPLGNYLPTTYDFDGTMSGCVVLKQIIESKHTFLFVEQHEYKNGNHTVTSSLYDNDNGSLKPKPLTACTQTADITPVYTWHNVKTPFIVEFRNRDINKIDGSLVPVSIMAGNENLIKDADEQYARIIWEQEAGKTVVFADADLFQTRPGANGEAERVSPHLNRLFLKLSGSVNGNSGSTKIQTHAPQLRTEQQLQAFNEILKRIELAFNIGKGTLSELESVQQTATQFLGGKKAFYSKVDTIESELEQKYKNAAYIFAYMASAYMGVPFNADIQVTYNDMTRKDPAQMKQTAMQEISAGILNEWEYRKLFYAEDEETAKLNVPEKQTGSFVL